jgi:hypothetical protein
MVTGATTDVAFQFLAHCSLVEIVAIAIHYIKGSHHHARRTESTLKAMIIHEGLLHGMQLTTICHTLDGGHLGAIGLDCQQGAGLYGLTIYMDDTGTALAGITTHMGTGKSKIIPQKLNQQGATLYFTADRFAIDCHIDRYHNFLSTPLDSIHAVGRLVLACSNNFLKVFKKFIRHLLRDAID